MEQLLEVCPKQYKLLLEFLVMSGLRWGEATALQRKDLRLDNSHVVMSVNKAWKKVPRGAEIGVPKTKASVRTTYPR